MQNLIAKHIPNSALNIPIIDVVKETGSHTLCAFTGEAIQYACLKKDVIGDNFTDHSYLRYPSAYISSDIAKLIVGKAVDSNGLRNYSFYATDKELRILKREEIIDLIFSGKETPFILGVTFSNKKHIAFKATPQYNSDKFRIYTDIGECEFEKTQHVVVLYIIQRWYSILPDKINTEAQPTYFTKAHILGESIPSHTQIQAYGEDDYFKDNEFLNRYRGTLIFKVLVHVLNKFISE